LSAASKRNAAHQGDPALYRRALGDEARVRFADRCSQRWSRVSITDIERHQLRMLRAELKIEPMPKTDAKEERSRRRKTA
jgi:hypothetical protein